MITIKNQHLTVKIAKLGAELRSVEQNGKELMWQGHPEIWTGCSPILFPICGGLKEDKFVFQGKEYTLPKHGYARHTLFEVEKQEEDSVTFLHTSNEETKKCFPFDYELRVIFSLKKNSLETEYNVTNTGNGKMYFSVGSHEAYATPEGIEDYDIIFPEKVTLNTSALYGNIVAKATAPIIKDTNVLPLYESYFAIDALVFRNCPVKSAALRNRKTGKKITVDFPGASSLLLWHKPNAGYMCVEPWVGIPDIEGSGYDITEKEGIITLDANKVFSDIHTITFEA